MKIDWVAIAILLLLCMIVGGVILAWHWETLWPLAISAIGLIIFMAG